MKVVNRKLFVWINEIDAALSMDDLKASKPIAGRYIPDFEILHSKITSALQKKIDVE